MRKILYIVCLFILPAIGSGQLVTGSWYGRADVEMAGMHNNYLTELMVKQKGNRVEGVFGYYFRDKYQSIFIHGTYNPKTREVTILNIPVIYYGSNSTVNSIDCNMSFRGVIINSKLGSALKGHFYHDNRYKFMCPDLKVSYELDRSDEPVDSVFKVASRTRMWKPQADDYVVDVKAKAPVAGSLPAITQKTDTVKAAPVDSTRTAVIPAARVDSAVAAVGSRDSGRTVTGGSRDSVTVAGNLRTDSMKAIVDSPHAAVAAMDVQEPAKLSPEDKQARAVAEDNKKIEASFEKRKPVLNKEFDVESDSVRLSFYDNGEIDGDSISVFVNSQVILTHQELAAKAFNIYLHLDSTREVNEISMFAENLGRLPPNTALMVVTDGKNRYEVFMSSNLSENATIRLRRKR